jgi:WD40 repeat protein
MTASIPAVQRRIFISYRREETAYAAGWLFDRLAGHFGEGQVFKDVDSIQLGDDFVEVITAAVGSCDVLLALIGDRWLTITDEEGRRRLDNPDDFVRLEIEAALARNVRVIPILVEGATMPSADLVPPSLARLVRRNALELSPNRFSFDTGRLLKVLESTLAQALPPPGDGLAQEAVQEAVPHPVASAETVRRSRASQQRTGSPLATMEHNGVVYAAAFSPDGTRLATASKDRTARLWDTATGREQVRLEHGGPVNAVAFSPDGALLATASDDQTARLWDPATGRDVARMEHGCWVNRVAFTPDGAWLATVSYSYGARLWDTATGRELARTQSGGWPAAFSQDGTRVAMAAGDGNQLWEMATGRPLARMESGPMVFSLAFSPDGTWLATGSLDKTARLWDTATGRELARMEHGDGVQAVAFSPDGARLATGSKDRTARLWDTATGRELARMKPGRSVMAVAFSPDGARLATGVTVGAGLWETATGRELARMKHGVPVEVVAFSPDGTLLATGSEDSTARLWSAANLEP